MVCSYLAYGLCFVMAYLLAVSCALSQGTAKQVTHQQLIWYGYHNTLELHPRWVVNTEVEERRFMNPDAQHQFLVRSQLRRTLGNSWDASVGFTYFLQSPQDPASAENLVVPELRPHLQLDYKQTLNKLIIAHRYRAERRYFRNTANGDLAEGYQANYRFRYRLTLEYPLFLIRQQALRVRVNDEIMINAGKRVANNRFDQNRIYLGLSYPVHKSINLEAGYLKWFQQRASGSQFYSRDIIRLIVSHKINLRRKETDAAE